MNDSNCLLTIESRLPDFSKKERKVADFILRHPKECIHPSIDDLAVLCEVSETTLFRFVRKIGYDSYQQFRIALAMDSENSSRNEPRDGAIDASSVIYQVFSLSIEALEKTMRNLDGAAYEKALDYLAGAVRVNVFGLGNSGVIAQDANSKFLRVGLTSIAPIDYHIQILTASRLNENDAALLFAYNGVHPDAILLAQKIHRTKAKLIFVTNYNQSPIVELADVSLFSTPPSSSHTFDRQSASITLYTIVDCLFRGITLRLGKNVDEGHKPSGEPAPGNETRAFGDKPPKAKRKK